MLREPELELDALQVLELTAQVHARILCERRSSLEPLDHQQRARQLLRGQSIHDSTAAFISWC